MCMLDGRICIVTGAAGSLGRASATRFAAEGAKVMLVDRDRPSLDAALKSLPKGQATAMLADVPSDTQNVTHAPERAATPHPHAAPPHRPAAGRGGGPSLFFFSSTPGISGLI